MKDKVKGEVGLMIGEREGAWLVCHWVGGGTRRKGGTTRRIEFTSEIDNIKTNEIVELLMYRKKTNHFYSRSLGI